MSSATIVFLKKNILSFQQLKANQQLIATGPAASPAALRAPLIAPVIQPKDVMKSTAKMSSRCVVRNVKFTEQWCSVANNWVNGLFEVRMLETVSDQSATLTDILEATIKEMRKIPRGSGSGVAWFCNPYLPGAGLPPKLVSQSDGQVSVLWSDVENAVVAVYLPWEFGEQETSDDTLSGTAAAVRSVVITSLSKNQLFPSGSVESRWLFNSQDSWWISPQELEDIIAIRIHPDDLSPSDCKLPFDYVATDNSPLGVIIRSMLLNRHHTSPRVAPVGDNLVAADIDVVAVTTDRFSSVRELLRSIRKHLSADLRVTIVVQSPDTWKWKRLSRKYGARFVHVAHDLGLSQSRNVAIDTTDRPIVFLMDDDFQVDTRCRLSDALAILNAQPEIAVLGGNLLDVAHWNDGVARERSQGFAMNLITTEPDIRWLRLEDSPRQRRYLNATDYVEDASIVDNFALIRRKDVFDRGIRWNPELKIGAEHQDLYLTIRKKGGARIARSNTLKVRNVRVQSPRFRRMRSRTDFFFSLFFAAQKLTSFEIVGERKRVASEVEGHAYQQRHDTAPRYVIAEGEAGC